MHLHPSAASPMQLPTQPANVVTVDRTVTTTDESPSGSVTLHKGTASADSSGSLGSISSMKTVQTNDSYKSEKLNDLVTFDETLRDIDPKGVSPVNTNDETVIPSDESFYEEGEKEIPWTAEETQALSVIRRKCDFRIISCIWLTYFLSRSVTYSVSMSYTMNTSDGHSLLQTVKGINSHTLSIGLAVSYVALIVFDLPSNLLMTCADPRLWLSRIQLSTGIIGACHTILGSRISRPSTFIILRLFNGLAIAGMWPGFAYYTSRWYRDRHLGKRIGWYYTAAQIASVTTSLLSAVFQKMDNLGGLYGFQWMFLIWGIVTFLQGLTIGPWLPPIKCGNKGEKLFSWIPCPRFLNFLRPAKESHLTPKEKQLHKRYMRGLNVGRSWNWRDLVAATLDARLWPPIFMFFGVVGVSNGIANYSSLIVRQIDASFSDVTVSLLVAPIYIFNTLAILTVLPLHDRYKRKALFFVSSACIILAGLLVTTFTPGVWGRYIGLLILGFGLGPTVPIIMAWVSDAMGPTHGDVGVAAGLAIVSGLGNIGSVISTYALYSGWKSDTTYRKSNEVMCGMVGIAIVAAIAMHCIQKFHWYSPTRTRLCVRKTDEEKA
ncbi:membrane transporter [Schizosaccharomyces japonicus yFS275]|uniref:Membrane transporter n=1 Tax=Schizosaccharomyces japonicus (strain yFS275 / FY16936) TaxID=402676 RepID=B6K158_SCHJY|nr:membrane transporter [Schizosaccharomyces japonicus yFS275]EEB07679.1 membrane transporter [Schizosaccharomyces japonicus yFS275]